MIQVKPIWKVAVNNMTDEEIDKENEAFYERSKDVVPIIEEDILDFEPCISKCITSLNLGYTIWICTNYAWGNFEEEIPRIRIQTHEFRRTFIEVEISKQPNIIFPPNTSHLNIDKVVDFVTDNVDDLLECWYFDNAKEFDKDSLAYKLINYL